MADRTFEMDYSYSFRSNSPRGWRQRLAQWLCRMAARLDGRFVMAVEVTTRPALSRVYVSQALGVGLDVSKRLVVEAVEASVIDRLMPEINPELYRQE